MNYRQWKKAYKKEHGYNPPKRKQRKKQAEKLLRVFNIQGFDKYMNDLVNVVRVCFGEGFKIIGETLKELVEAMQKGEGKSIIRVREI